MPASSHPAGDEATGPLAGRTAVVTGASRGIGRAIAAALVEAGARTTCLARSVTGLQEVAEALGTRAIPVPCDLARAADVARAATAVHEALGGAPDVLVQNAGRFVLAPVLALSPEEFARTMDVNLVGPYRLLHALLPGMIARGTGHVVTIGSVADRTAFAENAAYAASKFGARAVHEVLEAELRGTGVRASLVSPSAVDTSLWDPYDPDARPGFTPRARMLRPEAVAEAVLWVVTRGAGMVVGELRMRGEG